MDALSSTLPPKTELEEKEASQTKAKSTAQESLSLVQELASHLERRRPALAESLNASLFLPEEISQDTSGASCAPSRALDATELLKAVEQFLRERGELQGEADPESLTRSWLVDPASSTYSEELFEEFPPERGESGGYQPSVPRVSTRQQPNVADRARLFERV